MTAGHVPDDDVTWFAHDADATAHVPDSGHHPHANELDVQSAHVERTEQSYTVTSRMKKKERKKSAKTQQNQSAHERHTRTSKDRHLLKGGEQKRPEKGSKSANFWVNKMSPSCVHIHTRTHVH